ncbi:MAG: cytochrome c oxidase assembly factor Coa1 family protein [Bacteroidia bacterium]
MGNPTTHKVLVTTGCLMWCAAFFGEAFQGQPYSTIGVIVSPILTIIGIFFWFNYYYSTRGHLPKFKTVWDNTAYIGGTFTLGFDFLLKHALEFWTFCILFWMGLVLIMVLTFRSSDAFEATKNYCQNNQEILSQTGEIEYYGVLVGGNMSTGEQGGKADLSFTIIGTKGNFSANSKLTKQSGVWTVENLNLR